MNWLNRVAMRIINMLPVHIQPYADTIFYHLMYNHALHLHHYFGIGGW